MKQYKTQNKSNKKQNKQAKEQTHATSVVFANNL